MQGTLAGYPARRRIACPLCSAMAADGSLLVGAGHAPPADTSLPPETLRIAMDRSPIRRGRINPARRCILAALTIPVLSRT